MEAFPHRLFILGCGGVARCALPLILDLIPIKPSQITVMDSEDYRDKIHESLKKGVTFVQNRVTQANCHKLLSTYLQPGDIFLDLSFNVDTATLIAWCHERNVRYVNTSVEVWDPYTNAHKKHPTELTLYHRQMILRNLKASWGSKQSPTMIVDHGANPGLVSHFVKQALLDIAQKIISENQKSARTEELASYIKARHFASLAQALHVKTIHISERDTQITNHPKQVNEFVNTWSIEGLIEEGVAPAEMGWGTHEKHMPNNAFTHAHGPQNQICLAKKGAKTWVRSFVPSGEITGMVIRHGEAFSISDYLTVWDKTNALYRPTVHYAYCPSDVAVNSIHELEMRNYIPQPQFRLLADDIVSGTDELGCLLMGHEFSSWWIGSILDIHEARSLVPGQNATTVQVAIGVVAALMYALNHPHEGLCLPDHLDHDEILNIAKPYLGTFISQAYDWHPLLNAQAHADHGQAVPGDDAKWQFSSFHLTS